jgi:hypothetical protein
LTRDTIAAGDRLLDGVGMGNLADDHAQPFGALEPGRNSYQHRHFVTCRERGMYHLSTAGAGGTENRHPHASPVGMYAR